MSADQPAFAVTRGSPDPEELAALTAVLLAAAAARAAAPAQAATRSQWADRARMIAPLAAGSSWRASGLPS